MFRRLRHKWNASFSRLSGKKNQPARIIKVAIFASGTGTNAKKITDYFKDHPYIRIALFVSNKPNSGAIEIAKKEGIDFITIDKEKFFSSAQLIDQLKKNQIDLIVLAGFLWKIPDTLIAAFRDRIINLHPALLPKYGGKGLYGQHVHEAVMAGGEKESGITIHYVDEFYDHGKHIFQEKVLIDKNDTPETLAKKVQVLEHLHFPKVIEEVITKQFKIENKNLR